MESHFLGGLYASNVQNKLPSNFVIGFRNDNLPTDMVKISDKLPIIMVKISDNLSIFMVKISKMYYLCATILV
jgi:hypothetical protein